MLYLSRDGADRCGRLGHLLLVALQRGVQEVADLLRAEGLQATDVLQERVGLHVPRKAAVLAGSRVGVRVLVQCVNELILERVRALLRLSLVEVWPGDLLLDIRTQLPRQEQLLASLLQRPAGLQRAHLNLQACQRSAQRAITGARPSQCKLGYKLGYTSYVKSWVERVCNEPATGSSRDDTASHQTQWNSAPRVGRGQRGTPPGRGRPCPGVAHSCPP